MNILLSTIYFFFGLALFAPQVWAKRSSEGLYTEPFDMASGGTSLTRASQEGILLGNPALLPLGSSYIRWLGLQTGISLDRDLASSKGSSLSSGSNGGSSSVVDQVFQRSVHVGQTLSLSFLNKNFAFSVFDRFEADLEGARFGDGGLPEINLGIEAYGGALMTAATQPVPWLSVGITSKYLLISDPVLSIPLADQTKLQKILSDKQALRDELNYGKGQGFDLGLLFLSQGKHWDSSLGIRVEDLGTTSLSNGQKALPQMLHLGLGFALHGTKEVLHLSLEKRDVLNAYSDERAFKKLYVGARLMLRKMVGVAVGFYEGIPTAGIRADLYLLKFGVTAYGRELGSYPGDRQRNLVTAYTSIGF